ncbi:hypothetical protein SDC9_142354 [bioreactor metagenome]|uniref:Peptidase M50 domain-containing protein n=1 Tax=bioreactor metagenome TaxID=1076179 RepID=A0A645E0Y0_9ZZZZ
MYSDEIIGILDTEPKGGKALSAWTNFTHNLDWTQLLIYALRVVAVLICIVFHEVCHGYAAYLMGDTTAKRMHRLSLNPLRHIDPFGALMMLTVGFGWAKPVPIDMRRFKHPKLGMAVTALAGPASNFVLAYVALLLQAALYAFYNVSSSVYLYYFLNFLTMLATLSIGLGIFNIIPFPPLDGSKVVGALLPNDLYYSVLRYERYGMFILMAVLWSGILDSYLSVALNWAWDVLFSASAWPYYLVTSLM